MPTRNLTIKERFNLINEVNNENINVFDAANNYKCHVRTVFRCLSNQNEITNAYDAGCRKRTRLDKNEKLSQHDELVRNFILVCQQKGIPLSANIIKQVARQKAIEINRDELMCSSMWFKRFKERINLKLGKFSGERNSINQEKVKRWKEETIPRIMMNWSNEFIYNCDETGLLYRQVPLKTYFISKTDHIGDTVFKERVSILFCVNRNGGKLPVLVIGKSVKPRDFFTGCLDNLNVDYFAQANAWMTRQIFEKWLANWHRSLVAENKKVVLILDNFKGHQVDYDNYPNITFHFLPSSTTSLTQPLDAGIIRSFKSKYMCLFVNELLQDTDSIHVSQIAKKIKLLKAINWIDSAWNSVTSETIVNCWTHFGYINSEVPYYSDLTDKLSQLSLKISTKFVEPNELLDQITFDYVNYLE
ncbi:tigger transposable element-derived protein 4-like [Tetranychus urticae]|uniref:tigger transposable element-derived protein 4-like n=1 Tax=Tetranychus urticae TaxID=32264 RepID=UPI00077B9704|nr:tigger transposable element-derived protein 4-like [Tetranychus urticae]